LKELRQANRATSRALQAAEEELRAKREAALSAHQVVSDLEREAITTDAVPAEQLDAARMALQSARTDLATTRKALKPHETDDPEAINA
jgi:hypothetical protein